MGPDDALDAFSEFGDMAEQALGKDPSFDPRAYRKFTRMTYLFCCEIHGETVRAEEGSDVGASRPLTEGTPGSPARAEGQVQRGHHDSGNAQSHDE